MQSNRTPDRVHVVQRPGNDDRGRNEEIVRTLAQISDKLKRSEAERYELLAELREYRKALSALEDKTEMSEKAYLTLEHKIQTRDKLEGEISQRQARFEKTLKETEEKLVKTVAGQAVLNSKFSDFEDRSTALTVRIDESAAVQTRLNLQLEKVADDKSRMLRKVDRLEEVIQETQDALKARAMVLLTDQSMAARTALPHIPAVGETPALLDAREAGQPWWRRSVRMQSIGMGAMIAAALLLGWAINQVQQPNIPQIALLEGGGLARLNLSENRWEPVSPAQTMVEPMAGEEAVVETPAPLAEESTAAPLMGEPVFAEEQVDEETQSLFDEMEQNPDAVAEQLNAIEPGAAPMAVPEETPVEEPEAAPAPGSAIMPDFDDTAFVQREEVERAVAAEKDSRPLSQRIAADPALPGPVRVIERRAFVGEAQAQHDLAAIYTAGHAGVTQDFAKAAQWFRVAADNGVANARYNLGVLYHQGLGVKRDLGRALYWYREAAKLGHPEAQYNLGIAYIEGIGTDYNPLLAAAYFERAANQGIIEAAYNLGLIYENGLLGEAQPAEALSWYKKAADQGSDDAAQALKTLSAALSH